MENMLQKMMKRFPMFIAMGFMIVMIALIIGAVNSADAAQYYAVDKVTRDASTEWAQVRAGVESTIVWLPYFKFLGVAMILAGITMALGVIATRLEKLGKEVMASVPRQARFAVPARPKSVMFMRIFMMLGMLIIVSLIWALGLNSTVASYWNHSIANELNPAQSGSALLTQLATIKASLPWINLVKFTGMSALFTAITVALTVIIRTLQHQEKALLTFIQARTASGD